MSRQAEIWRTLESSQPIRSAIVTARTSASGLQPLSASVELHIPPLDRGGAIYLYERLIRAAEAREPDLAKVEGFKGVWDILLKQILWRLETAGAISPLIVQLIAQLAVDPLTDARGAATGLSGDTPRVSEARLVTLYVRHLFWGLAPRGPEAESFMDEGVNDAKHVAWACTRRAWSPSGDFRQKLWGVLQRIGPDASNRLIRLERAGVVRPAGSESVGILRFVLDPVCEYLAALCLIENMDEPTLIPDLEIQAFLSQWPDKADHPLKPLIQRCVREGAGVSPARLTRPLARELMTLIEMYNEAATTPA